MKLDIHAHINSTDPDALRAFVETCERTETVACLCTAGPRSEKDYPDNAATLKAARQYPGCIIPFAFVDLWETADADEVSRYADQGFKGLKCINPYYPYDDDGYMPVYERAEQLKLPILFHTGAYRPNRHDPIHRRPVLTNMHPLTLDRIARSFPGLKLILAHLGTTFFRREAAELIKLHPNLYADLAGNGSWMAIQPAELSEWLGSCIAAVDASFAGFRKLVLGSDAYVTLPHLIQDAQRHYEALLKRCGVPPAMVQGILGDTAAAWLH